MNYVVENVQLGRLYRKHDQRVGSKFSVFCALQSGSKPINFLWNKDGHLLSKDNVRYRINQLEDSSILTIAKLIESDSGNFSCVASNQFSDDTQWTVLSVKGLCQSCVCVCVVIFEQNVAQLAPLNLAKSTIGLLNGRVVVYFKHTQ